MKITHVVTFLLHFQIFFKVKFPVYLEWGNRNRCQLHTGKQREVSCEVIPVVVCGPQGGESEAGVPVQFGLALGPLDGSFEAFAEEALEEARQHSNDNDNQAAQTLTRQA